MHRGHICYRDHICYRETDPTLREGEGASQEEPSSFKIMLGAGKKIFRGEKANVSRKERSRKANGLESMHLWLRTDKKKWARKAGRHQRERKAQIPSKELGFCS